VVKRLLHFKHSRRRRIDSASLLSRESTTLSLANPQKGHFMALDKSVEKRSAQRRTASLASGAKQEARICWLGRSTKL
jgi:hypothetical protein